MAGEIGKALAAELSRAGTKIDDDLKEQRLEQGHVAEIIEYLHRRVSEEVDAFNQSRSGQALLSTIMGGNGVLFTFGNSQSLAIQVNHSYIELNPVDEGSSRFIVLVDNGRFTFQAISNYPGYTPPMLSSEQFISSVLRQACGLTFDRA